jgi:hypothetical protein
VKTRGKPSPLALKTTSISPVRTADSQVQKFLWLELFARRNVWVRSIDKLKLGIYSGLAPMSRWKKRRIHLAIVTSIILCLSILVIAPRILNVNQIPGSREFWRTSDSYRSSNNESFTITVLSVEFTFLFGEVVPLDAPIPMHFRVTFPNETTEYLVTTVGGLMMQPPRVVSTTHTSPQAAIVSAYSSEHEAWYSWYYAVSLGKGDL